MKYKVGDVVLVKTTITEVDEKDVRLTYRCEVNDLWIADKDVYAIVAQADPEQATPEPLRAGEFVKYEEETCQILRVDNGDHTFRLLFSNGAVSWREFRQCAPTNKPADWPF